MKLSFKECHGPQDCSTTQKIAIDGTAAASGPADTQKRHRGMETSPGESHGQTGELERLAGRFFSVGHSNNEAGQFFKLLEKYNVKELVDVRSIPSSGKFPHFKRNALQTQCQRRGIAYRHCPQLGNKGVDGGILALLATEDGAAALEKLASSARQATLLGPKTAMMCAEADWRECHRQVVAQRLLEDFGIVVAHIKRDGSLEHHPSNHVLPPYFGAARAATKTMAPRFASAYSAEALCCAEPALHESGYSHVGPSLAGTGHGVDGPLGDRASLAQQDFLQMPHPPPAPAPGADLPPEPPSSEASGTEAKPKRRWGRV
eukprot:s876_g6.t1